MSTITLHRLLKDGIYSTPHIRVLTNAMFKTYIIVRTKKRRTFNTVKFYTSQKDDAKIP